MVALVPATDNRPGEDAYVPGDVITMYNGMTVEVLNTDAEGRLILADALHYAKKYKPELVIDMATLTGAARVALGPQLPPYFTDDEGLAADIEAAARAEWDPMWRLPLWKAYADALDSDVAGIKVTPNGVRRNSRSRKSASCVNVCQLSFCRIKKR